jgi:hypothetical protein
MVIDPSPFHSGEPTPMIDVAEAIEKATELFRTVYRELIEAEEIVGLMVEEVELADAEKFWFITLGFSRQGEVNPSTIGEALGQINPKLIRRFKTFKVNAETGQVVSMKDRVAKSP